MTLAPDTPSVLMIPEILEQILVNVPIQDFASSCRAVCRNWRELVQTSSILKYYHATGIRGLPVNRYEVEFNPRHPPELTPAAKTFISLFRDGVDVLERSGNGKVTPEYISRVKKLCEAFGVGLKDVELFVAPPHIYSARLYVIFTHENTVLLDGTPGFLTGSEARKCHANPFIHLLHELCWRDLFEPQPDSTVDITFRILYRKNPGAFKHWSYMMLNGAEDDEEIAVHERGDVYVYGLIEVERDEEARTRILSVKGDGIRVL